MPDVSGVGDREVRVRKGKMVSRIAGTDLGRFRSNRASTRRTGALNIMARAGDDTRTALSNFPRGLTACPPPPLPSRYYLPSPAI